MLRSSFCLFVIALALAAANTAAAAEGAGHNRYKWRDDAGNLHYSDSLPAEAAKYGYEVVGPQGIVVKRVEPAKSAEELAAAKAAAVKQQAERDETDKRARTDAQLLAAYPAESDLKRAQAQRLDMLNQQINAAELSLRSQEQTLADLLSRAADVERSGKALPEAQAQQLAQTRKQVDDQRLVVTRRENERDQANAGFETQIAHYRALQAKIAQP